MNHHESSILILFSTPVLAIWTSHSIRWDGWIQIQTFKLRIEGTKGQIEHAKKLIQEAGCFVVLDVVFGNILGLDSACTTYFFYTGNYLMLFGDFLWLGYPRWNILDDITYNLKQGFEHCSPALRCGQLTYCIDNLVYLCSDLPLAGVF